MTLNVIYIGTNPNGETVFGLDFISYEKVRLGYGCSRCILDYGGIYHSACPDCGLERDVSVDITEPPAIWMPSNA